jgi:hypothetical protein
MSLISRSPEKDLPLGLHRMRTDALDDIHKKRIDLAAP